MFGPGLASFFSRRIVCHRENILLNLGPLLFRLLHGYHVRPLEKWFHQKICQSYKGHFLVKLQEAQSKNLLISCKLCCMNISTKTESFTLRPTSENEQSLTLLASLPQYQQTLAYGKETSQMISEERFQELVHSSYADKPASEVVAAFRLVSDYNKEIMQDISDVIFNDFCDSLTLKFKDMNDEELIKSLYCLSLWPSTSFNVHNFMLMMRSLDSECCIRLPIWDIQTIILVGNLWYSLRMRRLTCYHWEMTRRLYRKLNKLTPSEYVQYMYFLNLCRKRDAGVSGFELGDKLEKIINDLSVEELGVVAMGFFKTETPVVNKHLIEKVITKLLRNIENVRNVTLCALLKVIRFSVNSAHKELVYSLQDSLLSQVPRLNNPTATQAILLGAKTHVFHEKLMKSITEKYLKDLSSLRLKELERFVQTLVFYDYDPQTEPCVYDAIEQELKAPHRKKEIEKFIWSFVSCVQSLTYRGRFPEDLIKHVFDILQFEGKMKVKKTHYDVKRQIVSLSYSVELEFPEYTGSNISPEMRRKLAKVFRGQVPFEGMSKINFSQLQTVQVADIASRFLGQEDICHICHILPHFHSPEIVFCLGENNCPVPIPEEYKSQLEVKYPLPQHGMWYCIVYAGYNSLIRNTRQICGQLTFKIRQLRKIGYKVTVIPWTNIVGLQDVEKQDYIEENIKTLIRNQQ